jgi:putative FmdB family regulatory protein
LEKLMATYDYRCEVCSKELEVQRSIEDVLARDPYCPNCTVPMKRVYSLGGVVFKGNGWGGKP